MMRLGLLILALPLVFGCSGGSSDGDVAGAQKAIASGPKSVDELPSDMPEQARAAAGAGLASGSDMQKRMEAENDARMKAMQEMNKQRP